MLEHLAYLLTKLYYDTELSDLDRALIIEVCDSYL